MNTQPRKKICWNCEGNVPRHADNCPYCGVYLHPNEYEQEEEEDEESAILAPPYNLEAIQENTEVPPPPYAIKEKVILESVKPQKVIFEIKSFLREIRPILFPLIFLLSGSIFLLFSLCLMLFSEDGWLTIRWNAKFWIGYLLASLGLLFLGWKSLEQLKD